MAKFKMPKGLKVANLVTTADELNELMELDPVIKTKKRSGAQLFEDIGGVVAELDPAKDELTKASRACLEKLELLPETFKEDTLKCPEGHDFGLKFNEVEACEGCDDACFDACEDATKNIEKGEKSSKKSDTKSDKKKPVKKAATKGPGVIASILECIEKKGPVKQAAIVKFLSKRFPDRDEESMSKTVRAQIAGKKRPCRMEKEKKVTFVIKDDKYSIK